MTNTNPANPIARFVPFALVGIVLLIAFSSSFYTVQSGEKALVFTWGKITTVTGEGLNFKIPFIQSVLKVDVRTLKAEAPAVAASKNMQSVHTTVTVNYHLDPNQLGTIYSKVGLDVEAKIIDARIQEVVKAVVAKYTADELLAQRETVKSEISALLTQQVAQYNIVVETGGVQITNFQFSEAFVQAIEQKQIAEQNALKAKNDLDRIKVEAEQQIATARGTAEAIRIQADAIRAQGGKEYVGLKAIEKWNGQLPTYMGGNGPLPFIDVK
jgi:regulator of protease activity HflC (stomatin/prohibitin superfamily)